MATSEILVHKISTTHTHTISESRTAGHKTLSDLSGSILCVWSDSKSFYIFITWYLYSKVFRESELPTWWHYFTHNEIFI